MKKIIVLISLQATLMAGTLTNAMLEAKNQGRPLMIMVTSKTCTYCDKMQNLTLSDASVKEKTKEFNFIKVDESDAEAKHFLGKHIEYPPTIFFLSKYKILNKAVGYLPPSEFIPWVEDTKRKLGTSSSVNNVTQTYQEPTTTSSSINWMYDIPSAIDYAAQTGKQILIFVSSSSSKWSRELEEKTLADSSIQQALNSFVLVKVEKRDAGLSSYGLSPKSIPTVYFMTSRMRELVVSKGFFDINDFFKYINYAKGKI